MKKIIYSSMVCCLLLLFASSCGGNKERVAPAGSVIADLSKFGKPFTFFVPDSTKGLLTINEQNYMLEVRVGKSFGLVFEEGDGDMEQLKADLKGDDVNKFKNWIAEEPTLLAWTSEITQPESHLYAIVTVGSSKYVVRDLNSTDNEPFKEDDVKKMIESIKSIMEKPKEN